MTDFHEVGYTSFYKMSSKREFRENQSYLLAGANDFLHALLTFRD